MQKDLILLFDSIRDPRDIAEVIHLGLAADIQIEFTGSSIPHNHHKVISILDSWIIGFKKNPDFSHVKTNDDFAKRIKHFKKQGYEIIGTSSQKGENIFSADLSKRKQVIVFGTETSGLSEAKMLLMDKMLRVPMKNGTKFFTLRAVAPVFAFEVLRQKKLI